MEYTTLGSSGSTVSALCFRTWQFNEQAADGTIETTREQTHGLLDRFSEAGGNFVDIANDHGAAFWVE